MTGLAHLSAHPSRHSRLRNPESASLTRPMDGANPGMKRIPRLFFTPQDVRRHIMPPVPFPQP